MTMNSGHGFENTSGGIPSTSGAGASGPAQFAGGPGSMDTPQQQPGQQSGSNIEQARQQMGDSARELKSGASQAKRAVADSTRRTATQAKEAAGQMAEKAKQQTKQLTEQLTSQVRDQGSTMINEQKSRAADSLSGVGSAIRRAAETLEQEQDPNLARYSNSLADSIDECASYLRDSDPRTLMRDAGEFTRRRPEWVLGGAFLAGMALVRFLKASQSEGSMQQDRMGAYGRKDYDYATSDDFLGSQDASRRTRIGGYPGAEDIASDTGPDCDLASPDMTRAGERNDLNSTDAASPLNPDVGADTSATRNPSTGATF